MISLFNQIRKILFVFDKNFLSFLPLIILFLFASFLELLSLGLIVPYIKFLIQPDPSLIFGPFNFSILFNENITRQEFFIYFSLIFILIFFIKTFFIVLVRALISRFSLKNLKNLQVNLMTVYQNMNYKNFIEKNHSEYIRNIRELGAACMTCLEMGLRILSEIIVVIAIFIFLLFLQPIPLLIITSVIFLSYFFYSFYLKPKAIKYGKKKVEATKLIYQSVDESFKGFKEIKILGKLNFFKEFLRRGVDLVFKNDFKSSVIISSPRYFLELVIVIFIVLFLSTQIFFGANENDILPIIGVFAVAGLRIMPSTSIILNSILMIGYSQESLKIIYDDLKKLKIDHSNKNKNFSEISTFQNIEFKNVNFGYPNAKNFVLTDINLKINKDECIGLIGDTGSGKTTFVDIILGFLSPSEGKILINEKEIKLKSSDWSNQISYLPQDHLIINDTLEKNITLSFDKNINKVKLNNAINQSDLTKLIQELSDGVKTKIGEGGVRLSGGQYKKICLARLFYHEKQILILDEATNSLDKISEEKVMNNINVFKGKKTIILISHNHNTLKNCDRIFRVSNRNISDFTSEFQKI
tara:strand:- start:1068 stop:2816 length:1749 start_codon:yes stop_codon:yes gene_type:complete